MMNANDLATMVLNAQAACAVSELPPADISQGIMERLRSRGYDYQELRRFRAGVDMLLYAQDLVIEDLLRNTDGEGHLKVGAFRPRTERVPLTW